MRAERLSELLRRARRLVVMASATRATGIAAAVLFGAVLLAFLLDAVLALSPAMLLAVTFMILVLAVALVVYVARQVWKARLRDRALARLLEDRHALRDSRLINAVDLSAGASAVSSASLVEETIRGGEMLAGELRPRTVVDTRPLRRSLIALGGVVLAALVLHLALPGMFSTVSRRYLSPGAGHRPYTMIQFDVVIEPEAIYYGRPARVVATLSGQDVPDRANVVFIDIDETQGGTLPMMREGPAVRAGAGVDSGELQDDLQDSLQDGLQDGARRFALRLDRLEHSRSFYVDTPNGRSEVHTIEVLPVPLFEQVVARYTFPEYTGWGVTRELLEARGVTAIAGTTIDLEASSNIPLREGWIELVPKEDPGGVQRVRMKPLADRPHIVTGSFDVAFDGRFTLSLVGADGTPSDENRDGSITAVPDGAPIVEITSPPVHLVVPEAWTVLVNVTARDDVGIGRIEMSRAVNGWGPTTVELEAARDRPGRATASYLFDLPSIGARAGDVITYFATAFDTHPSARQFTDTPTYVLEVITNEEYEEFARTQYRMDEIRREMDAFNRRLERLGVERQELLEELDKLREAAEAGTLSPEDQARMELLEKALKGYADEARKLAEDMAEAAEREALYDFEEPLKEMLRSMSAQMEEQAGKAGDAAESMTQARQEPADAGARQEMADAIRRFQESDQPFSESEQQARKQVSDDLEAIAKADRLSGLAEQLRQVIFAQRDLADRLAAYRGKTKLTPQEELRAHRLAEEQDHLREALEATTRELRETVATAKDRLPKMCAQAEGFCDAIDEMKVTNDQLAAADLARVGFGDEAVQAAERAAENLEKLLSDSSGEQMQQQGEQDLDGCLKMPRQGMGNSLGQLAQGRSVPGLGRQPGGQPGSGFAGSRAQIMVEGPHVAREGESEEEARLSGTQGAGRMAAGEGQDGRPGSETLTPETRSAVRAGPGTTWGVPVPYRDQVEAYFRRLADESREP